ncbi:ATP-binding cassette domain-containing protein [Sinimarinibacterium sp. CAU 1509]|uniref:ABC transporter ATP-binding protein n=1 Tax=Sinimarinibacterium sp. CAU 1509 TaxID=2562283 RepID=UPI0010AD3AFE|nr:ATP-binding cassette domain-containing protein [Sinimarinibacterium sp. CAU 1509]TJY59813.1 ATP-binding cassette domain-containing protein [Sinimarinibacterium sp. CAU 1509]
MSQVSAVSARAVRKDVSSGGAMLGILTGVDLEVPAGQTLAIVGASGSGKTTLLSLLAGLDLPSAGEVWLDGKSLNGLDEDARAGLRAGRVGFVFQSFQLLAGFTALENVMLPAELAGLSDPQGRARQALDQVGLAERMTHYPHQLSGGEQQRVAIARAFCGQPSILFADEPTGNLDTATGSRIIDLLFNMNLAQSTTLILVTHDVSLAQRCDRTVTLREGTLHDC